MHDNLSVLSLRGAAAVVLDGVRERLPSVLTRAFRLAGAAVASYLVAVQFVTSHRPVTAALTALLIVQVTLVGTIADTIRRIVSVVLGVGVAIAVSSFVGFTWWSLGVIIVASIVLGQAFRLGGQVLEVPISAMLILAVGGAGVQAVDRVEETLVGALVGLLVNVIFPPAVQARSAGAAVERFAEQMARLLDRVAYSLTQREATIDEVRSWLDEARCIANDIDRIDEVLAEAGRSRQLNPRAVGTEDTTPDLRSGLDALEHSAVALRSVFRALADRSAVVGTPPEYESPDDFHDEPLREAMATLMTDLALAVRTFGALVRAEVDQAGESHNVELAHALEAVGEARVRLTELLLVDPQEAPGLWELHGALLSGLQRVLAELDVEARLRQRQRRRDQAREERRPGAQAAERLRSTTRRVVTEHPPRVRWRRNPR